MCIIIKAITERFSRNLTNLMCLHTQTHSNRNTGVTKINACFIYSYTLCCFMFMLQESVLEVMKDAKSNISNININIAI